MNAVRLLRLLVWPLLLAVAACGFALRGATEVSFDTLAINVPANSEFGAQLRRRMQASAPDLTIVEAGQPAQVRLEVIDVMRDRLETSLNAQGRVQEYELILRLVFRVVDRQGEVLLPDTELRASRLLPWDDNVSQAKESEADMLYRAMQNDMALRLLNRLAAPDLDEALLASQTQQSRATPAL